MHAGRESSNIARAGATAIFCLLATVRRNCRVLERSRKKRRRWKTTM